MEALAQGSSVANQGMAQASNTLNSVANIFNSSASLALKMNALLEQEEARKQQELLQTAQFMHNVQQDEFMNKYRQNELNFRKENAEAVNKYRYDDLNFRKHNADKSLDLKKTELLLKYGQNQFKLAKDLSDKWFKLKKDKNNILARVEAINKELNSENLTIEQRNALLKQKQALQDNVSLIDEQIKNISSQFSPQNQNFNPLNQNQRPTLASYNPSQQTAQTVGSNVNNERVTQYDSVFNQQGQTDGNTSLPEIKTYNNSTYIVKDGNPITVVDNNGKIIEGNLKKALKDFSEPTQQTFLLRLYKNISDNFKLDTGGIANAFPKTQNIINSLAKHIKDKKTKDAFISTAYISLADKIGSYPEISDIDKYKFGFKIANQFDNPKILNEVSKRLGLPVKSTYTLLNYKDEDIYHIYKMVNDQGTISSLFEIGFHKLGLNPYDIEGVPVTKEKMRIGLYQTLKELAKDGYNDYNMALALKELKNFSHNKFFDTIIKGLQLYGYKNKGTLAETIVDKIDLSKYKPKLHLSKSQQRADAIKEGLTLGGFKRTELYKQNIDIDPAISKIKQIFSTENINLDGDYELPVLVYGEPITVKVKGEDIVNAYISDILLPKFKDIIKDSKLEPVEILNRKNINAINKWTNE